MSFLDKTDRISHEINYPGYGYVRMSRPTRNKTFLVPSDTTLFEGDADGKILWTTTGAEWAHIWEPLLMSDGNVLLATFLGASLDVVDRDTHMVTKRYGTKTMPMAATFRPTAFAEFQILPNGNLITSNWQGHGEGGGSLGVQVIEFNPGGEVVWFYKQDPTVFTAIQGVQVIDGMDPRFLHVQEISLDSTWQPVIPTP
jgi:outer membrane protein assembly factor BamB